MDKDLLRLKRRQEFIKKRTNDYNEVIKESPRGITRENLERFKKRMKEEG